MVKIKKYQNLMCWPMASRSEVSILRPEFLYKLIYRIFFSHLGSGGTKKKNSSKNDKSVDWSVSELFFPNIFRTNSKTSLVNQQSVINL